MSVVCEDGKGRRKILVDPPPDPRELPHCLWCVMDCHRGIAIAAGYFHLRDAVSVALEVLAAMHHYRNGYRDERPVMSVEPWFQTSADEFLFWAKYWARPERAT